MPAPSSIPEFLDCVRRSGVLEEERLNAYMAQLKSIGPSAGDPGKLAAQMVRDGILTYFQAEQFLQGKWKRFHIGKYKVLERLGAGGMGQVFLCEHKLMRRKVAVKVLPTAQADNRSAKERFYREARAIAALDHPNLVRAFDIDQDDSLHFLVMEFVDGSSFQDIIKKHGPMDPLRVCHYIHQAAVGLDYAFQVGGIVHRDIKPGNVLVDRTGVVKILDMGLAKFFHEEGDPLTNKFDDAVLGTADYLAPEQAMDSHSVDIRADIYSLGATFYYMLAGRPLFLEGSVAAKLICHQQKEPTPLKELRPELSNEVIAVVNRMLKKTPADRYQNPAEVAEALAPLTGTPIAPPPDYEMPQLSLAATAGTGSAPANPRNAAVRQPGGTRSSGQIPTLGSNIVPRPPSSSRYPLGPPPSVVAARIVPTEAGGVATLSDGNGDTPATNPFSALLGAGRSSPRSGQGLLEAVYAAHSSISPLDDDTQTMPSRSLWFALGVLGFLVSGAIAVWWWINKPEQVKEGERPGVATAFQTQEQHRLATAEDAAAVGVPAND